MAENAQRGKPRHTNGTIKKKKRKFLEFLVQSLWTKSV